MTQEESNTLGEGCKKLNNKIKRLIFLYGTAFVEVDRERGKITFPDPYDTPLTSIIKHDCLKRQKRWYKPWSWFRKQPEFDFDDELLPDKFTVKHVILLNENYLGYPAMQITIEESIPYYFNPVVGFLYNPRCGEMATISGLEFPNVLILKRGAFDTIPQEWFPGDLLFYIADEELRGKETTNLL